jgi:class 3 adenylate cyclase/FixJ family two-component response regulator
MLNGAKIVIVDDDTRTQLLWDFLILEKGATLLTFDCGESFLGHFSQESAEKPDLVLLDIRLPGKSGFEILETALQMPQFATTLFASFSAYMGTQDDQWLGYIGFDAQFVKPIDLRRVISEIEILLEQKAMLLAKRDPYKNLIAAIRELSGLRLRTTVLENDYIKRLVSPEVFKSLESNPHSLSPNLKHVAVGFVDIRQFVQLMNRAEIGQINQALELFFDFVCECILKQKGIIDKFVGDAVMWFHNQDNKEKSDKACIRVAAEIIRGIPELNRSIEKYVHFKLPLKVGIGAAAGTCAVGMFGSRQHRIQYSAIGPSVNLAARLCSEAKAGEIRIGGGIIEHCFFATNKVSFKRIKGFDHKVEIRSVVIPSTNSTKDSASSSSE